MKIDRSAQEKADLLAFLKTLTDETLHASPSFSVLWSSADGPGKGARAASPGVILSPCAGPSCAFLRRMPPDTSNGIADRVPLVHFVKRRSVTNSSASRSAEPICRARRKRGERLRDDDNGVDLKAERR